MQWVFLVYKIPSSPSSKRLYVWRKLKKLGAVALQDAVFALPHTEKTLEQFQWLAVEIAEMEGESSIWLSMAATRQHEENLKKVFCENVDRKYTDILTELRAALALEDEMQRDEVLKKTVQEYLALQQYDYFGSCLAAEIQHLLREEQQQRQELLYGKDGWS